MNKRKVLWWLIILLLLFVFFFSGWRLFSILFGYKAGEESFDGLEQEYLMLQPTEPEEELSGSDLGTEPLEAAPIAVDFERLLSEYPDVVGWIYCPDTPINYPVLQAENNNDYLRHLPDGTYNSGGSIFLDYRCASDFSGWNSILYGHNMKNDSMFGTLPDYKEQAYYDAHPVLYLLTPDKNYKVTLFGGYTTAATDEDTYTVPEELSGRDALVETARRRSTFQTDITLQDGDRLLILSTCAYDYENARYVLVGILQELAPTLGHEE